MDKTLIKYWTSQAIREYEEARDRVRLHYPRDEYVKNYVNYMRERWEKYKEEQR